MKLKRIRFKLICMVNKRIKLTTQKRKFLKHLNLNYVNYASVFSHTLIRFNYNRYFKWFYEPKYEILIGLFSNGDIPLLKLNVYYKIHLLGTCFSGIKFFQNLFIFHVIVQILSKSLKKPTKFKNYLIIFIKILNFYLTKISIFLTVKLTQHFKMLDENKLNKLQQNIIQYLEKVNVEYIISKLDRIGTYIRHFSKRIMLVSIFYFLPYVSILGQLLSPNVLGYSPNQPIFWDLNLYKLLSQFPYFKDLGLTILFAGLPLAYAQNFQLYLIMGYFLIVQKTLKKLKVSLTNRLNIALSITFLLCNYAIFLIKSLLYGLIARFYISGINGLSIQQSEKFLKFIEWTLPLYLTQPLLALILIGLLYNCIVFVLKGYNPDIPIITISAKKQLTI